MKNIESCATIVIGYVKLFINVESFYLLFPGRCMLLNNPSMSKRGESKFVIQLWVGSLTSIKKRMLKQK
jgi:hypothetical protein